MKEAREDPVEWSKRLARATNKEDIETMACKKGLMFYACVGSLL